MSIIQKTIEEIRLKADIVDVVEKYLPSLKKAGRNHVALCPFHPEKTPSFTVSRQKGIFHCFGCQKSGDVFKFIQLYENITWPEAVKKLGEIVGVEVVDRPSFVEKENQKLYDALQNAVEHYQKQLFETYEGKNALGYLKSRALSEEIIRKFQIGFSRGDVPAAMAKSGFDKFVLAKSGLIRISDGNIFEYMSGRIVFPIKDTKGRVIAFGGRTVDDSRQPKYLNTPETTIFTKGSNLYGFSDGLETIKKTREVIVVEGYMDVIASHQHGLLNTVSCLGVALTSAHVNIIKKYIERLALIFDSDDAGVRAAIRAAENLLDTETKFFIVSLPDGCDPDDFLALKGKDSFVDYIRRNKKDFFEFHCEYLANTVGAEISDKKVKILRELFKNISKIKSPLVAQDALKTASERLDVDINLVCAEYSGWKKPDYGNSPEVIKLNDVRVLTGEETLINILINMPGYSTKFKGEMFLDKRCMLVWSKINEKFSEQKKLDFNMLLNELPDDMKNWFTEISMLEINVNIEECVEKIYSEMNYAILKTRQKVLEDEVKNMISSGNIDKARYEEYSNLTKTLKNSLAQTN